ncbi:MAG: hypothetical protein AAF066_02205 [Pseudomonadota bacterium]
MSARTCFVADTAIFVKGAAVTRWAFAMRVEFGAATRASDLQSRMTRPGTAAAQFQARDPFYLGRVN